MARRRMFSLEIIDTDMFLEMPQTTQNLYFHLGMRADDDGFVSNPKRIMKMMSATDDDFKILLAKQFIIPFENGVCVIKHWRIHNYIQSDRYKETIYKSEKSQLIQDVDGVYTLCIQDGYSGKDRLGKDRLGKDRLEENIVVETYNKYCTKLPQCIKITDKRSKAIKEFSKQYTFEQFEQLCIKANTTAFLIGQNDRKWKADIDFLLRIDKATSILEGKYDTIGKNSGIDNLKKIYEKEVTDDKGGNSEDIDVFSG